MAAGEEQSREYLRRQRLPELLHRLGALLLFHRPEKPREFLIQVLERVKAGRRAEGEYPFLMDEANVDAMFSLLDVLGQGHIRPAQYREALKTLGLSTEDLELDDDVNITRDVFKEGMVIQTPCPPPPQFQDPLAGDLSRYLPLRAGTTAGDEIGSEF